MRPGGLPPDILGEAGGEDGVVLHIRAVHEDLGAAKHDPAVDVEEPADLGQGRGSAVLPRFDLHRRHVAPHLQDEVHLHPVLPHGLLVVSEGEAALDDPLGHGVLGYSTDVVGEVAAVDGS